MSTTITRKVWGAAHGEAVFLFTLQNSAGAFVEITNYGATLVSVNVPDKSSTQGNVIISFPTLNAYLNDSCYVGSTIGRYANRVSNAQFDLGGNTYQLNANDGKNSNHSGAAGFNSKVFGFEINGEELVMVLHSNDGDGGFPGNLNLRVTYTWSDDNALNIHYKAVSDKDTFANFTNHAYFNLSNDEPTVLNHHLEINANTIVAAGDDYIPTGEIIPAEVLFDGAKVGEKIAINGGDTKGVNSFYILNDNASFAAKLTDQSSGRTLTVTTSYPGVFCYTGDYLNSKYLNTNNRTCQPFEGLCLECQHYPDAMNRPGFPSALLAKHQVYDEYINFKFGLI
jgi:aldose 1-epimerase